MSWRLEALKITEKIILENTFEHEKKENRVKCKLAYEQLDPEVISYPDLLLTEVEFSPSRALLTLRCLARSAYWALHIWPLPVSYPGIANGQSTLQYFPSGTHW